MNLSLPPKIKKLIEDRVRTGQYRTPEDVVSAAMAQLDQNERLGEFGPDELERILDEGEQSGEPLDGEKVLAELRDLRRSGQAE